MFLRHAASIADQALSLERGAITSQMGGRSTAAATVHILRILHMSSPHLSSALMASFARGGADVVGSGLGRNCTGVCIGVGGELFLKVLLCLEHQVGEVDTDKRLNCLGL